MSSRDAELSQAVKDLAERAARLYVKRRAGGRARPEGAEIDVLPPHEAAVLDKAGLDISGAVRRGSADPAGQAQSEYMAILASSLTVQETAILLGLSCSRIRQMIRGRSLAAIMENGQYRIPEFQFLGSKLVPHFGSVYRETATDVPLILFFRWFIQPSPDLRQPGARNDRAVCPKEWLVRGWNPEPIRRLARFL